MQPTQIKMWCIKGLRLGCGLCHLTESLRKNGFEPLESEILKTAIQKILNLYPETQSKQLSFIDFDNPFHFNRIFGLKLK
jgi:hypothetical protein